MNVAIADVAGRSTQFAKQFFHPLRLGAGQGGLKELEGRRSAAGPDAKLMDLLGFIGATERMLKKMANGDESLGQGDPGHGIGRRIGRGGGQPFFETRHESAVGHSANLGQRI